MHVAKLANSHHTQIKSVDYRLPQTDLEDIFAALPVDLCDLKNYSLNDIVAVAPQYQKISRLFGFYSNLLR